MIMDDFLYNRAHFAFRRAIDHIRIILALVEQGFFLGIRCGIVIGELVTFLILHLFIAQTRFRPHCLVFEVCWNRKHIQSVDPEELLFLGKRRTSHTSQFAVHAEIILDGDGGMRDIFRLHLHALLGFDCLVQTVGPAPSGHHATGKLIHDDDFAILDNVILISPEKECRSQGLLQKAHQARLLGFNIFRSLRVREWLPEQLFHVPDADFGQAHGLVFFFNLIIFGVQCPDDLRHADVVLGILMRCAGDD